MAKQKRHHYKITGIIQGVGFRPFLYRLAVDCGLSGFALNSGEGVILEVQGDEKDLEDFSRRLPEEIPPLAEITGLEKREIPTVDEIEFKIIESESGSGGGDILIPPDISTCDNCFNDISEPANRRFQYPFTNCTDCGPRYTIIKDLPYDRHATTMSIFKMCPECEKEYKNPADRRFHAEPNACPVCGPELSLKKWNSESGKFTKFTDRSPLVVAIEALEEGNVLGIKGLGGYHLACDAGNPEAVSALRKRKNRPNRPLAVMSADMPTIEKYALPTEEEKNMLLSSRRPIVFIQKRGESRLAENIAPNNSHYGVMLPYTPLHHLLMKGAYSALVMTSANNSGEPIIKENPEAESKLGGIADFILSHNRDILVRCDDSITRWDGEAFTFLRLSRGWAPNPWKIKSPEPDRLSCGAELKNTFTLVKNDFAFTSGHIGDLEDAKTYDAFIENIEHLKSVLHIKPELIAHDLHPDYLSTRYALEQDSIETAGVQHHHAHILSCMAEHKIDEPVLGLALDGTGYGTDGTIWGGELLIAERDRFERLAHLKPIPLPGGDAAAKEPWRMAVSFIKDAYGDEADAIITRLSEESLLNAPADQVSLIMQMLEKKINSPLTSSAGRLFAAVSAILGIRNIATFEGEAEMSLEYFASRSETTEAWKIELNPKEQQLPTGTLIKYVCESILEGEARERTARKFHNTLVEIMTEVTYINHLKTGIKKVMLSGGVFQNMLILNGIRQKLRKRGLEPFSHREVPTNDAGISLGQAYYIRKR